MKDYRKSAEALLAGQGLGADEGEASPGGDMYGDLGRCARGAHRR
jgi:hypothetical protein